MRFCVPQLSTKLTGVQTSLGQILQSIFDTVVLVLILFKAWKCSGSGLITLITRQGLAYYILNVATYLTWTLMLLFAPAGSKQVMGGPALGFVCISINRLTLHLRSYSHEMDYGDVEMSKSLAFGTKRLARDRSSWLGASTLDVRDRRDFSIAGESANELRDGGDTGVRDTC
ncbi:hypothetical protein SCHPADRAFT_724131 [Schizopora paradoxa]|uniref:Uncharacterized protein n=1 Tax=Schizopora paradoxa TaxID=27342 RepID=A0A0H2R149_9AGAM|nr:hypothetical protein SCHPADRAFT_724131 [Schizopora paradoxa]